VIWFTAGYIPGMRLLRGLAGALLWILSAVLALVAVLLCVTVILLPLGLPLLGYARRLFTLALKLMLPRAVTHPAKTATKSMHKRRLRKRMPLAS
jgi:hypothetical protein